MWNDWLQNLPKPGCWFAAPLLTKYLHAAHTLTPGERARLDAHLSGCDSCRAEADAVRAVETLLRKRGRAALPAVVPAADLWERIEGRIIAEEGTRRRTAPLRPALLFAPVLAAVAVVVVFMPKPDANVLLTGAKVADTDAPFAAREAGIDSARVADAPVAAKAQSSRVAMNPPLPRQTVPTVADAPPKLRAKDVVKRTAPRSRVADYVIVSVVPAVRETRPVTKVARAIEPAKRFPVLVARAAPSPAPITVVDVTPTPTVVAAAPTVTMPTVAASVPAFPLKTRTITVVASDTGTGVPDPASPVTDTLIRQRQKRGLFGGYGATIAVLPTGGDTAP
ncbi:MAG: zf-HC2 domain-containing protein [Armatimonadetes bacterium]|nr:zf-HC2 domain-containing protein [Armatimonadota bacterium]